MRRIIVAVMAVAALAAAGCGGSDHGGGTAKPSATGSSAPATPSMRPPAGDAPGSMAALGDSITLGVDACTQFGACPRVSWATGDAGDSHYRRLVAKNPHMTGQAHNLAVTGAKVADLPRHATQATRLRAEYVTMLIGANDACTDTTESMTPVSSFRASVTAALAKLDQKPWVFVASVPDLYRLWQIGHDNPRMTYVWGFGLCQSMLAEPTSTAPAATARRQAVRARVQQYNAELARACKQYGPRCRYDGGAVFDADFTAADVSTIDGFHPSATGQHRLAAITYRAGFNW